PPRGERVRERGVSREAPSLYHPSDGSTVVGSAPLAATAKWAAAATIAALSVHRSSGGIVRRALPPTTSAARLRRRVLAATPPQMTTSCISPPPPGFAGYLPMNGEERAASTFSRSDSTTDCSNA